MVPSLTEDYIFQLWFDHIRTNVITDKNVVLVVDLVADFYRILDEYGFSMDQLHSKEF